MKKLILTAAFALSLMITAVYASYYGDAYFQGEISTQEYVDGLIGPLPGQYNSLEKHPHIEGYRYTDSHGYRRMGR